MALKIGVHPNNIHLYIAQYWPSAFDGLEVEFVSYAEGRETGQRLSDGQFDIGGTGSTPPIAAQAAGLDVRYVAASAPQPANGAVLVAPSAPISGIGDLVGRSIALIDGSFHTYLLARALEAVGARLSDVERIDLRPSESLSALASGRVAAWIAMAPHLEQALAAGAARILVPCGDRIPNRSLFWTLARRGLSPATVGQFVAGLVQIGRDIAANPDTAAVHLAASAVGGAGFDGWRRVIAGRDWSIHPADAAVLREQQDEADTLFRHGALARSAIPRAFGDAPEGPQ